VIRGTVIHSTLTFCDDCGTFVRSGRGPLFAIDGRPYCARCYARRTDRRPQPPQWPAFDGDSGSQEYAETATLPPARRILKGFL
jgi:hypothetical protein